MKIKGMTEKYALREAMKPYVTETIYNRQKHPFMAPPVSQYSNTALNGFIQDSIRSESFKSVPFFDQKKLLGVLDNLENQNVKTRTAMEPVLMMVLTTHILHQKFKL